MEIPNDHVPIKTREVWLLKICEEYVDKYLGFDNVTALISQVEAVQPKKKEDRFMQSNWLPSKICLPFRKSKVLNYSLGTNVPNLIILLCLTPDDFIHHRDSLAL